VVGRSVVGAVVWLVGCSQNSLTCGDAHAPEEYPQVIEVNTHTSSADLNHVDSERRRSKRTSEAGNVMKETA
jgi:hypothetical protein